MKNVEFMENSELEIIDKNAFSKSSIVNITIPRQVKNICENAFSECEQLKCVRFDEFSELQFIDENAFYGSSVEEIIIPESLKEMIQFNI